MDNRLVLGQIHIIEWLLPADPATGRAQDRRTGEEVYRELKLLIPDTGSRVELAFHSVATRAQFVDLLERIEQESRASGKVPLLQIETHGDEEGIGPSHADGLTWPELMTALTPLNLATGVRLIVLMAACQGIWGIKMAQPMERAPFFALLGPNRNVTPGAIVRGLREFYRGMFEHKDGTRALRMLNNVVDPDGDTFGIFSCEQLFRNVWDSYLADATDEDWILARIEQAVRLAVGGRPRSEAELAFARTFMRSYILDHPKRFDESRRHFFAIDLFPGNAQRFNLVVTPVTEADPTVPSTP